MGATEQQAEGPYVLIVEDQPLDVVLLRRAIGRVVPDAVIEAVGDGAAALARLRGVPDRAPDLIVLDLNLPGPSGHDLLEEVRGSEHLRETPCVVLTSSKTEQDRARSLELGATAHVVKPASLQDYAMLAGELTALLG